MDSSTDADGATAVVPGSKEPEDKSLYQQRMGAWKPILDPLWVIVTLFAFGVIFIPVGIVLRNISNNVVEMSRMYDSHSKNLDCSITQANENKNCSISFTVDRDMEPPVLVYYEIDNFHQNHRKYATSRDDNQLTGATSQTKAAGELCDPLNKLGNIKLNPCGLIANTLFNDVITLESGKDADNNNLTMIEDGIAWQSDLDFKFSQPDDFKLVPQDSCTDCTSDDYWTCYEDKKGDCWKYHYEDDDTTQYLYETYPKVVSPIEGVTNEHFVVWMRVAAAPTFRKLYGWMDKKIKAGTTLTFNINANWDVRSFKGSKSLVVTTTSTFGGKNPDFGNSFIAVGSVCILFALVFGLKHILKPRKLGDVKYLKYKEE